MADYDLKYTGEQIDALLDTANELKTAGYIYKGVATPSTNPGTPTERVAYLASEPGTYTNFGSVVVDNGLYALLYDGSAWSGQQMQVGTDIDVDELNSILYSTEEVALGGLTKALGSMNASGGWTKVTSASKVRSIFIPVTPGEKYTISQGSTSGSQYYTIIDTMFTTSSDQSASNIDYATGYTGRIEITAGNSATIEIPSDGHYIVVRADNSGGAVFSPSLTHIVRLNNRVNQISTVLASKKDVTGTYYDHYYFAIANNVVSYTASDNWRSKIIPVADLVSVNLLGTKSDYSTLYPPVVFLRGAEPTQANWIQGSEMYGTIISGSTVWARLDTSSFVIPSAATHVLIQNNNTANTGIDSYAVVYDIGSMINELTKLEARVVSVDANGNGDYTTIADAINGTSDGDTIMVYPGTYEESVHAFGKERHIVGICKDTCILINGTGNYDTPPLEMNIGSIENMTIIADNYAPTTPDPSENHNNAAYGIHIEYPNANPYTIRISNCKIVSKWSAGIGIGLRYNQTVIIENCELISESVRLWSEWSSVWVEMGGLFFHNDAASNVGGTGKLRVKDTILRGKKPALVMESVENKPGTVDAEFIGTTLVSEDYQVGSEVIYRWPGTTTPEGYLCGSKITLAITSHGNNIAELNA